MNALRTFLVTAGGLGFMRPFPGTWGSLPPAGVAWAMLLLGASWSVYAAALVTLLLIGCIACIALGEWAEQRFGRKDASQIVADEVAGQSVALIFLPLGDPMLLEGGFWRTTVAVGAAFALFRIFDIMKPWPAHGLQKLRAGWGVLVDDLFAGAYAAASLHLLIWAFV